METKEMTSRINKSSQSYIIISDIVYAPPYHERRFKFKNHCYYAYTDSEELAYKYISQFRNCKNMTTAVVSTLFCENLHKERGLGELLYLEWDWNTAKDKPISIVSTVDELEEFDLVYNGPSEFGAHFENEYYIIGKCMDMVQGYKKYEEAKELEKALMKFTTAVLQNDEFHFTKPWYYYKMREAGLR